MAGWRRWSQLGPTERRLFIPQLVAQLLVRGLLLLVVLEFGLSAGIGGALSADESTGRQGSAVVRDCRPTGWAAAVGLAYQHSCDLTVTWSGGATERTTVSTTDLSATDNGSTVQVRELRTTDKFGHAGSAVDLEVPHRYTGLAWSLLIAVGLPALAWPFWLRPRAGAERETRRRRARTRARPALVVASGYWLVLAGGMAFPVRPGTAELSSWGPLTWPPLLVVILGQLVLLTGLILARYRARRGCPTEPTRPFLLARVARLGAGVLCGVFAIVGLSTTLGADGAAWSAHAWFARLALPVLLLALAARLLLVWWRQRALPRRSAADREPAGQVQPSERH
ncbi:DUF6346 domain-containing protein [Amycolatopsis aidingensis]|uniref:DUF6346 domain-containing protein n=1 Tax=Amycolatopsis aidingensis TaxID=2842453 RepID=UPI001C0BEF0E|nr:DUF6346 domain-containing protein [Amycolatopsis aidingensis]